MPFMLLLSRPATSDTNLDPAGHQRLYQAKRDVHAERRKTPLPKRRDNRGSVQTRSIQDNRRREHPFRC